jgi:hypothetical protein
LRRLGPLVIGGVAVLLIVVLAVAGQPPEASPEHAVNSDGAGGTSAFRQLTERLGRPTTVVEGSFGLPQSGLLVILSPTAPFTDGEAAEVQRWVEAGGTLVYGSESPTPPLEDALRLQRADAAPDAGAGLAVAVGSGLQGVFQVEGRQGRPFSVDPGQEALLVAETGVVGLRSRLGAGLIIALAGPAALGNDQLLKRDNAPLAADLVELAAPGAGVAFDEFHHGARDGGSAASAVYSFNWARAILAAVVIIYAGAAWRVRALGPPIPVAPPAGRSSREHVDAVGRLLRRTGAWRETLEVLVSATRRAVAERGGLAVDVRRPDFHAVLAQRAPEVQAALERAESLASAARGEEDMVGAARALHGLANPERLSRPPA